jgi:predicted small metal-binding protein
MENKSRRDELRDNPNNRQGKSFRCADAGVTNCTWSVTGESEDDIIRKAEQHARDAHGMKSFDENTRRRVHEAIRDRAA